MLDIFGIPAVLYIALLASTGGLFLLDLVVLLYALTHQSYAPIRSKDISLMSLSYISSLFWYVGTLHMTGFLGYDFILKVCPIWGVWFLLIFGITLFLLILTFRLYSLYQMHIQSKSVRIWGRILPALFLYAPILLLGVFSLAEPDWTDTYDQDSKQCQMTFWMKVVVLVLLTIMILALGGLILRLRKIPRNRLELKETIVGGMSATTALICTGLLMLTPLQKTLTGTATLISINAIATNIYFWAVFFKPITGRLFRRDAYLQEFYTHLHEEQQRTKTKGNPSSIFSPGGGGAPRSGSGAGPAGKKQQKHEVQALEKITVISEPEVKW